MDWTLLGIEPTSDKNAITRAYRTQLLKTNPEDHPEEFKALRAAYEQALVDAQSVADLESMLGGIGSGDDGGAAAADGDAAVSADGSQAAEALGEGFGAGQPQDVTAWTLALHRVYFDLRKRLDLEEWRTLFAYDICQALDFRPQIEHAMITFFLDYYFITRPVWQLIDKEFNLVEREDELKESYPRDFVDYIIISGVREDDKVPLELFIPGVNGKDVDQYLSLYLKADRLPDEEIGPYVEQWQQLSESHPYGDSLAICYEMAVGGLEAFEPGIQKLKDLADAYPKDERLHLLLANQYMRGASWQDAEKTCLELQEFAPSAQARWILAQSLAGQGRYADAVEKINDLMSESEGNQKQLYELNEIRAGWNEALIEQYAQQLEEDPKNNKVRLDLAWAYLQNEHEQEADALLDSLVFTNIHGELDGAVNGPDASDDAAGVDAFDFYNLTSHIKYCLDQKEEALHRVDCLIEATKALVPDGTEKTEKRMRRLAEFMGRRADCIFGMGDEHREEALAAYRDVLETAPEDPDLLTSFTMVNLRLKDYPGAKEAAERLIAVTPRSYYGYNLLGHALFGLRQDGDAFAALERAMAFDDHDLGVYMLRLRIMIRNGAYDMARETLQFLEANDLEDDPSVRWCYALLAEYEEQDYARAETLTKEILDKLEAGKKEDIPNWAPAAYFRLACLMARRLDEANVVDHPAIMEVLEKGLQQDENDLDCLDYKAWLLKADNEVEKALETYHRLERCPTHSRDVELQLAELYYKDLDRNAAKSLYYYEKLLASDGNNPDFCFYAGMCCILLGRFAEAEAYFLREKELEPEAVDSYIRLNSIYLATGRLEDALREVDSAIDAACASYHVTKNGRIAMKKEQPGKRSARKKLAKGPSAPAEDTGPEISEKVARELKRYYMSKVKTLRRLGRPHEAVAVLEDIRDRLGYDAYDDIAEVYMQFGLWDELYNQALAGAWTFGGTTNPHAVYLTIRGKLAQGDVNDARRLYRKARSVIAADEKEELDKFFFRLDGKLRREIQLLEKKRENQKQNGQNTYFTDSDLAYAYLQAGDKAQAHKHATMALEGFRAAEEGNRRNAANYRSQCAGALAILGDFSEARKVLEEARNMPLCDSCDYCACKDADIFEIQLEILAGDYARARELTDAARKIWFDDIDFVVFDTQLKQLGY